MTHVCFTDDTLCPDCGSNSLTVTSVIRQYVEYGLTRLEALNLIVRYGASSHGRTLYSGDGHPIPRSSYRPRKGAL